VWLAYAIACIPLLIGAVFWVRSRQVVWWEWVAGSCIGFAIAGIFHLITINSMVSDVETWSGKVTQATHHPWWRAEWTEIQTTTDSKGNTSTRIVRKSSNYPEHWTCDVTYGRRQSEYDISHDYFKLMCKQFGIDKPRAVEARKPNFDSGDKNIYIADNKTSAIIPANISVPFENRVQAAPSVFSYVRVPDKVPVYDYPVSDSWQRSNRLLGTAKSDFSPYEWDCLNAELGPSMRVNLITIGFGAGDSSIAQYQEAKWVGGKKNDLVICYGGQNGQKPNWVYCFGWTEKAIVKRNLESLFLDNLPNNELISKIKAEVITNYRIKDWSKFDYITIEPPWWSFMVLLGIMIVCQIGFWLFAHKNEFGKN
jgi:hypothetical protein